MNEHTLPRSDCESPARAHEPEGQKSLSTLVALVDEMETVFSDIACIHLAIRGMVYDIAKGEPQCDEGGGLEDVAFRAVQRAKGLRDALDQYCAQHAGRA